MLRAFICVICLLSISIRLTVSKSHSWLPEEEIFSEDFFQLGEVVPSNRYSCHHDNRSSTNDFHLRGTSLGGFLVLEPWITPSLFYQFLGATDKYPGEEAIQHFAFDSITFCRVLGGEEANRQLRVHWQHWVTSEQIANLAAIGVETVRIPVADWMFEPYSPFTNGCWEGAMEELDRVIALCRRHNLTVLLDLHAVRGSQNGLDNSGDTGHYEWVKGENDSVRFNHWALRGGDWAGNYDVIHQNYSTVNTSHLLHTLGVISAIVERYRGEKAVIGVQPVNEPWWKIPFPLIQEFYWRSYNLIRARAPHWLVLFHDSFRLSEEFWGEKSQSHFLEGCSHYAVDIHLYHAWAWDNPPEYFIKNACYDHNHLRDMEELGVPIVVGEWSLATDNCAMWLNGMNDNVPTYPKVKCDRVQCPDPYFPSGLIPNAPPDPTKGVQGPLGTGGPSYVEYGTCPVDRSYPDEVNVVRQISYAQLYSYDVFTHGFFFWNFRTELGNRWDYQKAVEKGWLPTDWTSDETRAMIASACYSSPSPPPSSAWLRWLIRVVAIVFLVACLALLLAVCLPQVLRHFHIVRSGYLPIHDTDRDTEER